MAQANNNMIEQVIRAIALRLGGMSPDEVVKRYTLDPFTYTMNFLPATASATTTAQFQVQNDSGFAICKTSQVITDTVNVAVANLQPYGTAGQTVTPFLITLSDSGSGRNLMDTGVHLDHIFGVGQRQGYQWTVPKVLDPNSTFTGQLQNLSATDRNVRLAFVGFKIFGDFESFKRKV